MFIWTSRISVNLHLSYICRLNISIKDFNDSIFPMHLLLIIIEKFKINICLLCDLLDWHIKVKKEMGVACHEMDKTTTILKVSMAVVSGKAFTMNNKRVWLFFMQNINNKTKCCKFFPFQYHGRQIYDWRC